MNMYQGIKQLEEKNVASEINYMVWSSRMDLVAFSNAKGNSTLKKTISEFINLFFVCCR